MKRRLLIINPVCGILSTGRICSDIARDYEQKGWDVRIGYGRRADVPDSDRRFAVRIGRMLDVYVHALISLVFGYHATGWCSRSATRKFVRWADEWRPDRVWLHNLHDNYINVEVLFEWLKSRPETEVLWTHHDCWAMTGCCTYFGDIGCNGWKDECVSCNVKLRRAGLFGGSQHREFLTKRNAFLGIRNMTLISPSTWVADCLRESFLSGYPIRVVKNTVDTKVFYRRDGLISDDYGIRDRKIILGVAGFWDAPTKGLADFVKIAEQIDLSKYVVVLIGVSKQLRKKLPKSIVAMPRLNSADDLAKWYSAAYVFFNPTQLDNYPTVNLEARACGCKIVTYDSGGCAETVEGYDAAVVLSGRDKSPEGFLRVLGTL